MRNYGGIQLNREGSCAGPRSQLGIGPETICIGCGIIAAILVVGFGIGTHIRNIVFAVLSSQDYTPI